MPIKTQLTDAGKAVPSAMCDQALRDGNGSVDWWLGNRMTWIRIPAWSPWQVTKPLSASIS